MEHDRIATLLEQPPVTGPEPEPRSDLLLRRFRRRRARRVAGATLAATLAVAGLAVPLLLLGGIGATDRGPGPVPAASGPSGANGVTAPATPGPGGAESGTAPDVGVFRCTSGGVETDTPQFGVQPDGVHLDVGNAGGSPTLVLHSAQPPVVEMPFDLVAGGGNAFVSPYLGPGRYVAACTAADGSGAPSWEGQSIAVDIVDPTGIWSAVDLTCAGTTERVFLVKSGITERDEVPSLLRATVNGIRADDEIVPALYPESTENVAFVVRRGAERVAVVRTMARGSVSAEAFDITFCDGSGIAEGQGGRG